MSNFYDQQTESEGRANQEEIEHSEMVRVLSKPGQEIIDSMTPDSAHMLHMAVGISGEVGELVELMALGALARRLPNPDKVTEELGDLEYFTEGFRQVTGITFGECKTVIEEIPITTRVLLSVAHDVRFLSDIDYDLTPLDASGDSQGDLAMVNLFNAVIGDLTFQAGLLLDVAKRVTMYNKPLERDRAVRALSMVMFYMSVVGAALDITSEDAKAANIEKLSKRYRGLKYSDAAAHARADKSDGN